MGQFVFHKHVLGLQVGIWDKFQTYLDSASAETTTELLHPLCSICISSVSVPQACKDLFESQQANLRKLGQVDRQQDGQLVPSLGTGAPAAGQLSWAGMGYIAS